MQDEAAKVTDQLLMLLDRYASELRSHTQPTRLRARQAQNLGYRYRPDDPLVRQSLMEHVGELPVVAVAVFPYLDDPEVSLGSALTMLAIHDIGEVLTGDVNTYVKKRGQAIDEARAARGLLHASYHQLYEQMEGESLSASAKFALAVDKLSPDVFELLLPVEYSVARLKHFAGLQGAGIMTAIEGRSKPFMLWNPFLTSLYAEVCRRLAARLA